MSELPNDLIFQPGEPMVDHQPVTPGAYFDIRATEWGTYVSIRFPDGTWETQNSWAGAAFAAGFHRINPAYMPGLYDKFHKKGNK